MKQVTITFDAVGNMNIDAEGFVGNTCDDATKVFTEAFHGKEQDRHNKPEYYQQASEQDKLRF